MLVTRTHGSTAGMPSGVGGAGEGNRHLSKRIQLAPENATADISFTWCNTGERYPRLFGKLLGR